MGQGIQDWTMQNLSSANFTWPFLKNLDPKVNKDTYHNLLSVTCNSDRAKLPGVKIYSRLNFKEHLRNISMKAILRAIVLS